jgi:hypothetical protein
VTLAVRNLAAGERTAEDIIATTGNKQVLVAPLDLADQASVASFAAAWDVTANALMDLHRQAPGSRASYPNLHLAGQVSRTAGSAHLGTISAMGSSAVGHARPTP